MSILRYPRPFNVLALCQALTCKISRDRPACFDWNSFSVDWIAVKVDISRGARRFNGVNDDEDGDSFMEMDDGSMGDINY